jgi:sulfate adenylyltransferase
MHLILTPLEVCDLEMLLVGAFAPLTGFLNEADYHAVTTSARLTNGSVWPVPIILSAPTNSTMTVGQEISLCLSDSTVVATMTVESIYETQPETECQLVAGTTDKNHPYTAIVQARRSRWALGGPVRKVREIPHYNYRDLRLTPTECRQQLAPYAKVVAFQTRNPLHRCHVELMLRALRQVQAEDPTQPTHLLLSPVVGLTQPGDVDADTRVRCYRHLVANYLPRNTSLIVLPLAMRMLGPREALWHAPIRQNYGATHFIIGRDHAGPSLGHSQTGAKFYTPTQAQEYVKSFQAELGIQIITSSELVYVANRQLYLPPEDLSPEDEIWTISGTQLRQMLRSQQPVPTWFSYPEVLSELQATFVRKNGICVYFIGLSGAGKSTLAQAVLERIREVTSKPITVLDGDVVRQHLSKCLGFSRTDRSINVRRIGFVASEIVRHGGLCLCANIAPYEEDRQFNRHLIEQYGTYLEVYVDTPLNICEKRDVKGLYEKARRGEIGQFTGISDPFEPPSHSDLVITSDLTIDQATDLILAKMNLIESS